MLEMKNTQLNLGGVIGAVVGLMVPSLIHVAATGNPPFGAVVTTSGFLVFVGAAIGNRIWR